MKDYLMESSQIEALLLSSFPDAKIDLTDLTGTKDHWNCRIITEAFNGLNPVQRHQKVYTALGEHILGDSAPIHALKLATYTPQESA
jgi:stress-induced morphogen